MTGDVPAPGRLPYPHTRNDCGMCRERDADFHILGEQYNQPGKRQLRLRQLCVGKFLVTAAIARRLARRAGHPHVRDAPPPGGMPAGQRYGREA